MEKNLRDIFRKAGLKLTGDDNKNKMECMKINNSWKNNSISDREKKRIYYFQVEGSIEERNKIANILKIFGFKWLDMTGGQAGFKPIGDFENFKKIVYFAGDYYNHEILECKNCVDPGLGLF